MLSTRRGYHKNPITPYAGRELSGVVKATWLRGRPVRTGAPHGVFLGRAGGLPGDAPQEGAARQGGQA